MAVYLYQASNAKRARIRGTLIADSPRHARDQLRARGLRIQSLAPHSEQQLNGWLIQRSFSPATRVCVLREIATLISVGTPILESLDTLIEQYHGVVGHSLTLVRDGVAAGSSLAEAMGEQPALFDELTVRMVEVGEQAGNLDGVLENLTDYLERSLQMRDRVLSALLYPAIVFGVSLCVSVFLMVVVVPMLLTSLLEAGRPLPWPTVVLKFASDLLLQHWLLLLVSLSGLLLSLVVAKSTLTGRRILQSIGRRIPVVGAMLEKQAVSRVSMVIAALMRSGMVYVQASEFAAKSSKSICHREALYRSGEEIAAGVEIGEALRRTGVFAPLVIHVFSVGQKSGRLEEMLERLAKDYDRQVESLSSRLASVIEPVLIFVLAIFVGFILFATLLPILEVGNVL